jgi:hypothetical protein
MYACVCVCACLCCCCRAHPQPLSYLELLNAFEFTWDVYAAFFILMGIIITIIGGVIWAVNRILTKLRHPPKFRFWSLITIVSPAPFWGCLFASVPFWFAVLLTWVWFFTLASKTPALTPASINFENWSPQYSTALTFTGPLSEEEIALAKRGRFATCLLVFATLGMIQLSRVLIPNTLDSHYDDDITKEGDAFDQVTESTYSFSTPRICAR